MTDIVTLTMNSSFDTDITVEHVVAEKKLRCDPPIRQPGGGGINVSRAIKKLDGQSTAVYTTGGLFGSNLLRMMEDEDINSITIDVENETRESINVVEKSSKQQYRFVLPGPHLKESEWRKAIDIFDRFNPAPNYVVASGSLPPGVPVDFYSRLAKRLKRNGSRFILDSSGSALQKGLNEGAYLIKPNMNELRQLAGEKLEDEASQKNAAVNLIKQGKCQVVALSLGTGGAMLITSETIRFIRAPSVPIRSKVGAGDSMVAGIVLALSKGMSVEDAVIYGVAAGSAAVMTPGSELCRLEDTEDIYESMKEDIRR